MSPFFWRHLAILFAFAAILAAAVLAARFTARLFRPGASVRGVALRAAAVAFGTCALVALLLAVFLFLELEIGEHAGKRWAAQQAWQSIRIGMTPANVTAILGPPDERRFEDLFIYQLHPIPGAYEGVIHFDGPAAGATAKVESRSPDGEPVWLPPGLSRSFHSEIEGGVLALSALGLVALALASLIPFRLRAGARAWMLYTPAAALVFGSLYEATVSEGWRFDLFLLLPAYALIVMTWLVRLWMVRRS